MKDGGGEQRGRGRGRGSRGVGVGVGVGVRRTLHSLGRGSGNCQGGGRFMRILQRLIEGSSTYYRDTTRVPRPSPPGD